MYMYVCTLWSNKRKPDCFLVHEDALRQLFVQLVNTLAMKYYLPRFIGQLTFLIIDELMSIDRSLLE